MLTLDDWRVVAGPHGERFPAPAGLLPEPRQHLALSRIRRIHGFKQARANSYNRFHLSSTYRRSTRDSSHRPTPWIMSLLNILEYPDPRLRTKAVPVSNFGSTLEAFTADMLETMYHAPGIGLAATQVNVHERIIVVDVSENKNAPFVLVNPRFQTEGNIIEAEEGCLSVPGFFEPVERYERILVEAFDPLGNPQEFEAEGLLAVCIQHECDHLDGKLFVDYLSSLKRNRIRKKLTKQQKQRA